jgi:hypothetical protein
MIAKEKLVKLYVAEKLSVNDIANQLGFSVHKVIYWMDKYGIKRRTISDAIYILSIIRTVIRLRLNQSKPEQMQSYWGWVWVCIGERVPRLISTQFE